jgi:hypothetical protein
VDITQPSFGGFEEINRKIQREGDSSGDGLLVYNVYNVFNPI